MENWNREERRGKDQTENISFFRNVFFEHFCHWEKKDIIDSHGKQKIL